MSLIIAMKTSEGVVFGADSAITQGDSYERIECFGNQKIWEVPAPLDIVPSRCLMGGTGMYRENMAVRYNFSCIEIGDVGSVINNIIPRILDIFVEKRFMCEDEPVTFINSSYLLADTDHIYTIDPDLSVVEHKAVAAIGARSDEAIGCLLSMGATTDLTNKEAIDILVKVFEACAEKCNTIYEPYYFKTLIKDRLTLKEKIL